MANEIQRIRYFNGLFLKEDEFNLEQSYHIRMRRLHNRHLHSRGIVWGLEVKEVSGTKKIRVTKGMALNRVLDEDGEEVSQEIILPEDEERDLSGYSSGESVYIYIKYSEEKAQDEYFEPEPGKEPYWWERARIGQSTEKPFNENEYIILARVDIVDINEAWTMQIQYAEEGESLRVYAGFSGKRIETEKLTLRIEDAFPNNLPFIEGKKFILQDGLTTINGLNINSPQTNFTGSLTISDDLIIEEKDFDGQKGLNINSSQTNFTGSLTIAGDLTVKGTTTTVNTQTLDVIDSIIMVNKYEPQPEPEPVNGGLEVFRGGTAKNAQIIWDEGEDKWKIGLEGSLFDIAYSDRWGKNNWEQLTNALSINDAGNVGIGTTTPEAKLDIAGNLRLRIGEGLELLGDNNYFGENKDARVFRMIDNNGGSGVVDGGIAIEGYTPNDGIRKPIMAIRGNGQVGIGTIDPELRFVVNGSAGIMGHCTVGYKGSAVLNVRHIAGMRGDNDDRDNLFLQWNTGFGVQINRQENKGFLNVYGDIIGDYLIIRPQDTTNEGGEIQLQGTGGAGHIHIDNRQGHCRIHTLDSDKQFQVIGGGAYIAGKVGIGTMSPDTKLHVNGNIRIEGDRNFLQLKETDGNPNENFCIGVNDGLLRFNSADDNFSGVSRMVIDQKGNVGIGITTDLNAKLHISGSSGDFPDHRSLRIQVSGKSNTFADHIYITAYNKSTTDKYGIAFGGDGHHRGGIYAQNAGGTSSGDGNISIWNRNGTSINLVGGNVGIGTTNPAQGLELYDKNLSFFFSSRPENYRRLYLMKTGIDSSFGYKFSWRNDDGSLRKNAIQLDETGSVYFDGGNVGIGTTDPGTKLVVDFDSGTNLTGKTAYGGIHLDSSNTNDDFVGITADAANTGSNAGTQAGILFQGSNVYGTKMHFLTTDYYANGMKQRMIIDHQGNVGIGTTNPDGILHVEGEGGNHIRAVASDSGGTARIKAFGFGQSGGLHLGQHSGGNTFVWNADNGHLIFGTNSQERIRIASTGNVGIGTITPESKLHVYGTITADTDQGQIYIGQEGDRMIIDTDTHVGYFAYNGTRAINFDNSGNVGIGTKSPQFSIDVYGNGPNDWVTQFKNTFYSTGIHLGGRKNIGIIGTISLTDLALNPDGGNVGIGKTNPVTELDVNGAISGLGIVPIGSIIAWHKSFPNTPALPDGWVECNGQVLNDPESPYDEQTIPNLNSATEYEGGRFLRGSTTSGEMQEATAHVNTFGHHSDSYRHVYYAKAYFPDGVPDADKTLSTGTIDANNQGYKWGENKVTTYASRPVNMSVVWIMRVK